MRDPEIETEDSDEPNDELTFDDEHPTDADDDPEDPEEVQPGADDASEDGENEDGPAVGPHPEISMKVQWVPRRDLVLEYKFWLNPRTMSGLSDAEIEDLKSDIVRRTITTDSGAIMAGIKDAIEVVQIDARGTIVNLAIDGQRRLMAVDRAKMPDALVPVTYVTDEPVTWTEALAAKYLSEVLGSVGLRKDLSSFELSEAAARLVGTTDPDTGKMRTNVQIAEVIRRSPSWVSKILTAREAASPSLVAKWRSGAITEEQFRDLATSASKTQQSKEAEKIVAARASGNKGEARRVAKEAKETARAERAAKPPAPLKEKKQKGKGKGAKGKGDPAVRGPQSELPIDPPAAPAPKPKALSFAVIEDLLETAKKRPPTSDLVKGVLLGIQIAAGIMDMAALPQTWHKYWQHVADVSARKKKK